RLGGGLQQGLGSRQKDLPRRGEHGTLGGAVEQARAELPLQAADLSAQRRLGNQQFGGGAAEVAVGGHDREVAHQAQVEVGERRRRLFFFLHAPTIARSSTQWMPA